LTIEFVYNVPKSISVLGLKKCWFICSATRALSQDEKPMTNNVDTIKKAYFLLCKNRGIIKLLMA
jgi:hypothetical protein